MTELPPIWYFESSKKWWMESGTPRKVAEILREHVDAINVTNAYSVLDPRFIAKLRDGQIHS